LKPTTRLWPHQFATRLIDLMLSACESTHVSAAQAAGASMAFVETGFASTLDRNMPFEFRQRLFDAGYAAAQAALQPIAQQKAIACGRASFRWTARATTGADKRLKLCRALPIRFRRTAEASRPR